jgi:alpha-beta hydrolase superfamily lysophospholipase
MSEGYPQVSTIRSADGLDLHATFYPGSDPKGVLVVSHGLGEHSGCYEGFARTIAGTPETVDVLTFDYRGHGRSPGRRGVVRRYADFVLDLRSALDRAAELRPGAPLFLMGHSNGGQVALHAILAEPARVEGLILSNPSLRIAARVPAHKYVAGLVLRRLAPFVTLTSTVTDEQLTRDPESLAQRRADPLRHGRISAPLFFGMVEGGATVLSRAESVQLPALMILGAADTVVDPTATRAFFDRLGSADKTLKVYPEALHEPLNDVEREAVVADILAWLSRHLDAVAVGE